MAAPATCSASECAETADQHCSRCHTAAYCSVACQTRDWPGHKPECKRLVAAAAAAAAVTANATAAAAGGGGGSSAAAAAQPPPRRVPSGLEDRVEDYHCALPTCARRGVALPQEGSEVCGGCHAVV